MKKIIVAMVLMLGFQMSQAQTVDEILKEFRKEKGTKCVRLPWLPIKLVSLFSNDESAQAIRRIKSIRVLVLSEDCSEEVRERFVSKMSALKSLDYELLLTVKDDDSDIKMWGDVDGENIKDLLVDVIDDKDIVLCRLKGKLKVSDINVSMSKRIMTLELGK